MADSAHDDEIPTAGRWGPHTIPDLRRVPRERWEEVLRQTHASVREKAAQMTGDLASMAEANMIGWRILDEERARAKAARAAIAFAPPLPGANVPRRTRYKQVNFRLTRAQHEDLCEAGSIIGMKPTSLARMLVIRGVTQMLAEATARDAASRAAGAP